jgi:hypothetical protein
MYWCNGKPRPTSETSYLAQDGWFVDEWGMTRKPKIIRIKHVMSTECNYDQSASDARCEGCEQRRGENETQED